MDQDKRYHRLVSDPFLENLKGNDGLASCSDGQGEGAVVALGSLHTQFVGEKKKNISHGTQTGLYRNEDGLQPF